MLELSLGAALLAVLGVAVHRGVQEVRAFWQKEAHAAESPAPAPRTYRPAEQARLAPRRSRIGLFGGLADDVLLAPLRRGRIARVKVNTGGTSISLRLDFEDGGRAAFKPRQTNFQSRPRREVAAFRVNRLLGLDSVAPAIGRRFPVSDVLGHLEEESQAALPRLQAEMIPEEGQIAGELSWWIPVIKEAKLDGFLLDSVDGVVTWSRYLTIGVDIPAEHRRLLSQLSNMLLFDLVINNSDRWSGRNVRVSEDGDRLYFMDNTLAFGPDRNGHYKVRSYLEKCQKFSRSLVSRMREVTRDEMEDALSHDLGPFEELLSEQEIDALMARRDLALAYVDQLIDQHGEEAVLVFP